jgi:hypothetical protein
MQPVSRERIGKHIPAATNTNAKIYEEVFSVGAAPGLYEEELTQLEIDTRVKAGSNTSTVTLRVVGGDEKEV